MTPLERDELPKKRKDRSVRGGENLELPSCWGIARYSKLTGRPDSFDSSIGATQLVTVYSTCPSGRHTPRRSALPRYVVARSLSHSSARQQLPPAHVLSCHPPEKRAVCPV